MEDPTQQYNSTPNEPSKGSQWRFWQKAFLAALSTGVATYDAQSVADYALDRYNAKWKEMFKS
jgi:hypothetical protein